MAETIDVRRLPRLLWIATLLYWVLLSVLTHVPLDRYIPEEKKKLLHLLDKPEHVIAYFILTTLLGCSLVATFPNRRRLVWLAARKIKASAINDASVITTVRVHGNARLPKGSLARFSFALTALY